MSDLQTTPLWHHAYRMNRADWIASECLDTQLSGAARKIFVVVFVVAAFAGGNVAEMYAARLPAWLDEMYAAVGCALVAATLGYLATNGALLMLSRWRASLRPRDAHVAVDLFADRVAITRNDRTTCVPWGMMLHVHATPEHVVLFPSGEKPLLLPRRLFASEADMMAFFGWVESRENDNA